MVEFIKRTDPLVCLQFWFFIAMNLLCLAGIIKIFKFLLYVTF